MDAKDYGRQFRDEVYMALLEARKYISKTISALEYPNEMTESYFAPFVDRISTEGLEETAKVIDSHIEDLEREALDLD